VPTNIRIVHAHDFIRATPEGTLDREETMRVLTEIAAAGDALIDHHVLLDTRKAHSVMTLPDLWFLAKGLATLRHAYEQKTAILCQADRFEFAEFVALCAQNRGLRVNAFTSFEDAIEWLIADWSKA